MHPVRRRDGEHPDGDPLRLLPGAGRRGVRPRCGFRPDGACPGKERTGCCPDAGDVRYRRRDPGACPGTWRRGCCLDGDRPDGVPNCPARRSGTEQPGLQPWAPGVRRALHRWTAPPWLQAQLLLLPGPRGQGLLPEQAPTGRGLRPELQPWVPEPWELPDPARGPDEKLRGWRAPWALQREPRTSKRRRRGRRCGVSSQRGPQWWKRQSERIRPVPAVWLLHLWK